MSLCNSTFLHNYQYSNFITFIKNSFNKKLFISSDDLLQRMPTYWFNTKREDMIREKYEHNMESIANIFKSQVDQQDWRNFDFLIEYFELKLDEDRMIIFDETNSTDFNDVNIDALLIWWIIKIIQEDYFVWFHYETKIFEVGLSTQEILPALSEVISVNIYFAKLGIIVKLCKNNDEVQLSRKMIKLLNCIPVLFDKNGINEYYLRDFRADLLKKFTNALVWFETPRNNYMILNFQKYINSEAELALSHMRNIEHNVARTVEGDLNNDEFRFIFLLSNSKYKLVTEKYTELMYLIDRIHREDVHSLFTILVNLAGMLSSTRSFPVKLFKNTFKLADYEVNTSHNNISWDEMEPILKRKPLYRVIIKYYNEVKYKLLYDIRNMIKLHVDESQYDVAMLNEYKDFILNKYSFDKKKMKQKMIEIANERQYVYVLTKKDCGYNRQINFL